MNRFDQYFQSEYIPQYVPLPLEAIDRGITKRQNLHEENLASLDQLDDVFRKVNYLPQDKQLRDAELNNLRSQFEQFSKEGDYSQARQFIRRAANRFSENMASGPLGHIQKSYQNYYKDIEAIDKSNRPNQEKELAKQMRFKQYQGIDPTKGELFGQVYTNKPVAEYVNVLEEGMKYAKELKPSEIKSTSPWFQTADGMRWLQNSQKIEELPAEVIAQVSKYALLQNPKALESLAFTAQVQGRDPNEYVPLAIENAANTLGAMYQRKNVANDQSMQQVDKYQYELAHGSPDDKPIPYEGSSYIGKMYFDGFDAIKSLTEGDDNARGTFLQSPTGGQFADRGTSKSGKFEVKFGTGADAEARREMYNNVAKLVPGKTDEETYNNVQKWIENQKDKGISVKHQPMSNKDLNTETEMLKKQFPYRKFMDKETGKVYHGSDIFKDKDGIAKAALKEKKGKSIEDVVANLTVSGRVSPDNPYRDMSGDEGLSAPWEVVIGSKTFVVTPAEGDTNSETGIRDNILNVATRANRTGLPVDLGKELGNQHPELKGVEVQYMDDGRYRVSSGKYAMTTTPDNLFITIARISDAK